MRKIDKELDQYRNLLDSPTEFRDGFGWSTVVGIFFCGLVMMPGSIYLGLMTGGDMTSAATWVTVILFSQVARRAMKPLSKQNLVTLLYATRFMMTGYLLMPGGPIGPLIFRAFLVNSDAVREQGMGNAFPSWWVPSPDSPALIERNLLHSDWMIPIGLVAFIMIISVVKKYTIGYFFYRLTSDIEKLPFPLAPIQAQGAMAMAEEDSGKKKKSFLKRFGKAKSAITGDDNESEDSDENSGKTFSKWRLFSLGAILGIAFGVILVGVPAITGLILEEPVFLIPQPFVDLTNVTEGFLPAAPIGATLDLGILLIGFVIPFWAVIGTAIAIFVTFLINPLLYHFGVLTTWQPGMDTVNTQFSNHVDFWLSFSIGTALGIAVVSIYSVIRAFVTTARERKKQKDGAPEDLWATPEGRGDYPLWMAAVGYVLAATAMIYVAHLLIPQLPLIFLILFSFVYVPLMSYVNARLSGISGQDVEIPFIREGSFILSGAKGIDIWLAPVPTENYGGIAQALRVNELTGVSMWSLVKAEAVAIPVLFGCSILFWAFIWKTNEVPSSFFPTAEIRWELLSKEHTLLYSSTFVPEGQNPEDVDIRDSQFMKAIKPEIIGGSAIGTVVVFALLSVFGLPVLLIYGFIRGIGQLPHYLVLELVGAIIGRYYFQKKFGANNFLRMAPTIVAGYFTGVGLIGMGAIAMNLIKQAVTGAPF
ncbi:OPT family oligopeptide transporter [Puniceicoccus vermicola]|uniref:Peptide transporter n=1 Tax=Puniceicoccus vermicola TaxID=388746 RepID=A0A7X1E4X9_9BACT|nr:peptide transporter [Puniceicoccus vermicola]MBC2602539.1 peptide transporter [Puniceicoccus vermicola]